MLLVMLWPLLVILFPICAQSDELVPPDSYTRENFHLAADLMKMRDSKLIIQSNLNDRSVVHRDTLINKIEKFEFHEDNDSSSEVPKVSHLWIFMTSHRNPPVEDPFTPSGTVRRNFEITDN